MGIRPFLTSGFKISFKKGMGKPGGVLEMN
jgi:hypothetical protein